MATVRIEDHDGGVRVLVLDRPPANAENEELLADLAAAVDAAREDDRVRAVVLTGAGKFFSGGFDLFSEGTRTKAHLGRGEPSPRPTSERREPDSVAVLGKVFREAHLKLASIPKPTIAMVNGHAIAGGLVLVLACDYRLGVEGDWKLGLNEVAIGASYPRVALELVKLRLPHARATELLLGAALYPANQAIRLGVADELFPPEKFRDTVLRRAARMGSFPREAYADTKALMIADFLRAVASESEPEALRRAAIWQTDESRAARAKQREKLGKS